MISLVFFENKHGKCLVAAFLMRCDALEFVRNSGMTSYEIIDVESWGGWSTLRVEMLQETVDKD